MTRPTPDRLDTETGSYFLWAIPPVLPIGDPRWEWCNFVGGSSTADTRGYGASWEVKAGRLYLTHFGGAVRPDDPQHQYRKFLDGAPGGKIRVGMPDVHEVDEPIFASWVTADLDCASRKRLNDSHTGGLPQAFHLFRIERGWVVADVLVDNEPYRAETDFDHTQALLDAKLVECGTASAPEADSEGVPGLVEALGSRFDVDDIRRVASLLWQAGKPDLDNLVAGFTTCHDPVVRRWIAYAIGRIGADAAPAVPMLTQALVETEDDGVLKAIAYALAGIGVPAASTLPTMISVVEARCGRDANRQIRLLIDQLRTAGESSIDVLIAGLLTAQGSGTQHRAADVLGRIGVAAVRPLVEAFIAAEIDTQRVSLARAFGRVGRDASPALPLLLDGLKHLQCDWDRATFAEAIRCIGLRSQVSLGPLRAAFRSAQGRQALREIADAIASLGSGAVDVLVQEFKATDSSEARIELTEVLGELGSAAKPAVECLAAAAARSCDGPLVREVAEALRKIGAPADLLATIQTAALKHGRGGYETDVILSKMRQGIVPAPEAIRDLVALLVSHGMDGAGRQIAILLGSMGTPAVEPLLAALGQADDAEMRHVIINALGMTGSAPPSVLDAAIREMATAPDDSKRLQLVDDVRRLGKPGPEHMEALLSVMRRSAFLPIWWRLGLVLADMGGPAVGPLVELLEETQDDDRRRALANALTQIGTVAAMGGPALLRAMHAASNPEARTTLATAVRQTTMRLA